MDTSKFPDWQNRRIAVLRMGTVLAVAIYGLAWFVVFEARLSTGLATFSVGVLSFLSIVLLVFIVKAVTIASRTRIVPLVQSDTKELDVELTRAVTDYRTNQERGRALARNYKELVDIAKAHALPAPMEWRFNSEELFPPEPALAALLQFVHLVSNHPQRFDNVDALMRDISDLATVLREATKSKAKFRLIIWD